MDRETVHLDNIGLGLQQAPGPSINAKLSAKSFETISTQSRQTTACAIPKCTNRIWRKETIRNTRINGTIIRHKAKQFIQQVCSKFLFLGRAVDSFLLCPISAIALQSSKPTEDTMQQTLQLLDYLATQENALLSYQASNMVLAVHSNTSYLSKPKAQNQVGGHFFLSSNTTVPPNNGAILNIAHIIKNLMSSATEEELAGLYIMAREAIYIRIILEELGHAQPPTPLQTNNEMADDIINGKVQPKQTKAMHMRFHWLRNQECQQQCRIYWQPGKLNYANYWTKHYPETHHCNMWKKFLTPHIVLEMLRMEQQSYAACAA